MIIRHKNSVKCSNQHDYHCSSSRYNPPDRFTQRSSAGDNRVKGSATLCLIRWPGNWRGWKLKSTAHCNPVVENIHLRILTWFETVVTFMEQWNSGNRRIFEMAKVTQWLKTYLTPFSFLFYSLSQSDRFAYLTMQ